VPPRSCRNLPFPIVIDPAAPPIRPERHIPNSIVQKSEQTGTGFRLKAAGDFGGKRHLISLQSGT
jgi:hypothetical protein